MAPVYTFEQITECYISYFDNGISLRFEFDSGADFLIVRPFRIGPLKNDKFDEKCELN